MRASAIGLTRPDSRGFAQSLVQIASLIRTDQQSSKPYVSGRCADSVSRDIRLRIAQRAPYERALSRFGRGCGTVPASSNIAAGSGTCTPCKTCDSNAIAYGAGCPGGSGSDGVECRCNAGYYGYGTSCAACLPCDPHATQTASCSSGRCVFACRLLSKNLEMWLELSCRNESCVYVGRAGFCAPASPVASTCT